MSTFYTATEAATVVAKIVSKDLVAAGLVSRDFDADFAPGRGLTVPVRIPGAAKARTKSPSDKNTPIVADEINEQTVDVTITDHVHHLSTLSEADLTLNLKDFSAQVLAPQAGALAKFAENAVVTAMKATPATDLAYDAAQPARTFTRIRAQLRDNGVPAEEPITALVGSKVYGDLLDGPERTFDPDGKVRGITVHESTRLAPDEIVAFIRPAFVLVARAPIAPEGAPFSASVSTPEFAARVIRQYAPSVAAEQSLVSVLLGARAMPLPVDNGEGAVELVEHGGAVRVLTGAE